ncbi:helix-turn-helix domain-containing protein [Hydrogenophaga sp. XSHU_21]
MTLPRVLTQASANNLDAIVATRVAEGPHIEFKRALPGSDSSGKHELVADVSAFANSTGGDIIFGIDQDDEGRASALMPLTGSPDEVALRIQDVLMNGVEPRIPGLQVHAITIEGGFCLVIRVPQSWAGPHRVKTNQHFYIREGARKRQIDIPEIRGLFLRTAEQTRSVRDFRTERVGKIISGDAPQRLTAGPCLIVHLIPTQAALGLVQIDPVEYTHTRAMSYFGGVSAYAKLNLDGAVVVGPRASDGVYAYSQQFRNGFFESVQVWNSVLEDGQVNLPSLAYEEQTIRLATHFRAELEHHGVGKELTCMLTLTSAKQLRLGVNRMIFAQDGEGLFDRDVVAIPDVLLPADEDPRSSLKAAFDMVWQSAGYRWSLNYNEDGTWSGRA